jgi:hypothetical protein
VKIVSCDTETSDLGPDLAIIETEGSGFTLLMSRDPEAEDFGKVYFDDSEILEGQAAAEMVVKLEVADNLLVGESLEIYNGILKALRNAI